MGHDFNIHKINLVFTHLNKDTIFVEWAAFNQQYDVDSNHLIKLNIGTQEEQIEKAVKSMIDHLDPMFISGRTYISFNELRKPMMNKIRNKRHPVITGIINELFHIKTSYVE